MTAEVRSPLPPYAAVPGTDNVRRAASTRDANAPAGLHPFLKAVRPFMVTMLRYMQAASVYGDGPGLHLWPILERCLHYDGSADMMLTMLAFMQTSPTRLTRGVPLQTVNFFNGSILTGGLAWSAAPCAQAVRRRAMPCFLTCDNVSLHVRDRVPTCDIV
eukprot:3523453-Rhodomonas_salina.3